MSVTFDTSGSSTSGGTAVFSLSGTFTLGSGTNRALAVVCYGTNVGQAFTVTWNGVTCPAISGAVTQTAGAGYQEWHAMVAPASGSHTLSISVVTADAIGFGFFSFAGADQTGGTTTFINATGVAGSGADTSLTKTITTVAGDATVGNWNCGTNPTTPQSPTPDYSIGVSFFQEGQHQLSSGSSDSYTMSMAASDQLDFAGFAIKAAVAANNPFVQKDWPNPTTFSREPSLLSWIQSYKTLLYQGQDQLPVRQQDWQVSRASELYPYRSFEAFYNRNLIGKDKFFDGPGNVPDFEYQVPRSPDPYPYRTWTQNLLQTTLAPSLAKPLAQYDWPLPRGSEPDWRRSWEFWFNRNLIGQDKFPVRQLDWQLPIAPSRIEQTWIVNLQLSTLAPVVTEVPFQQFDWPLPQGYAPLVQAGNQPLNLNLQPVLMMLPFQWDIVEGQAFANPSSSQNLLLTTLAPVTAIPFRQLDWPLPYFFLR